MNKSEEKSEENGYLPVLKYMLQNYAISSHIDEADLCIIVFRDIRMLFHAWACKSHMLRKCQSPC